MEEDDISVPGPGDHMLHHPGGIFVIPVLRVDGPEDDGTAGPALHGRVGHAVGWPEEKAVVSENGLDGAAGLVHLGGKVGVVEPGELGVVVGMDADLVLVDFTAPHLMPCHNVLTGLVYAAKGGDVAMTMVRGKILYQNGRFPTINLNAVVEELTTYAIPKLFAKEENDVE